MESTQVSQPSPAARVPRVAQVVKGTPVVRVVQADVYVIEKPSDNFWTTQAPPLGAVLSVLIAAILKWIPELMFNQTGICTVSNIVASNARL